MKTANFLLSILIGLIIGIILATGLAFYKNPYGAFGDLCCKINLSAKRRKKVKKFQVSQTNTLNAIKNNPWQTKDSRRKPGSQQRKTVKTLKINAKICNLGNLGLGKKQNEELDLVVK